MKSTNLKLLCIAFFGCSPLAMADQDDGSSEPQSSSLREEIIVTATRRAQPISDVLSVSTVVTREDIERVQARDVVDLLSREAGVTIARNGGRGGLASLFLRGNQSDHSLILIDGIRVGSATAGSVNISSINIDSIERIEIVRGAKSSLYGADAIGGVVNIITRKNTDKLGGNIQIDVGIGAHIDESNNQTSDLKVAGGFNWGDTQVNATVAHFDTEGFDFTEDQTGSNGDDDGTSSVSVSVNAAHAFSENVRSTVNFQASDAEVNFDSACSERESPFGSVDCDIFSETTFASLSVNVDIDVIDGYQTRFTLGRGLDESETLARNIDITTTFNGGVFDTTKTEATWLNFFGSDENRVTLGADYLLDEVDSTTDFLETSRDNIAAFANWSSGYDQLSWSFGVRYDENEQFDGATTFSGEAGYQINDALRFVASFTEGFKAPTFNDLYFPGSGNPDFVPEESQSGELALIYEGVKERLYIAAFRNDIDNLIQFNFQTFLTDQISEAEIMGVEFDVDYQIGHLLWGVSGSVIEAENPANGLELARRPGRSLAIDVDNTQGRLRLGASFRVEDERFNDAGNLTRLGGYGLTDLRLGYALTDAWQVQAQVNNLFDKSYSQAVSFGLGQFQAVGRELFLQVSFRP